MKYLNTYNEYYDKNNVKHYTYIGVKFSESTLDKLLKLGYKFDENQNTQINTKYIFIQIYKDQWFNMLYYGHYNKEEDIIVNINDIPKKEDIEEYIKFLEESNKMGLL